MELQFTCLGSVHELYITMKSSYWHNADKIEIGRKKFVDDINDHDDCHSQL